MCVYESGNRREEWEGDSPYRSCSIARLGDDTLTFWCTNWTSTPEGDAADCSAFSSDGIGSDVASFDDDTVNDCPTPMLSMHRTSAKDLSKSGSVVDTHS